MLLIFSLLCWGFVQSLILVVLGVISSVAVSRLERDWWLLYFYCKLAFIVVLVFSVVCGRCRGVYDCSIS